jgi:hypothetical protein
LKRPKIKKLDYVFNANILPTNLHTKTKP